MLRFVGAVLTVSGALLLLDAATTVVWQEPVSAVLAAREQDRLETQLRELASGDQRPRRPLRGDAIGRIELPTLGRRYFVVEGTDKGSLRKGPGHYEDTPLPGERGTVAIAGHRTTYLAPFRTIDKLRRGDSVVIDMTYGTFRYRVEKLRVVEPTEVSVKRRVAYDRLILSACHPLYSAAKWVVVFARFVAREPPRVRRET